MIHLPTHNPSNVLGGYSNSHSSHRSEQSSTVVTENGSGGKTTISATLTTSYQYSSTHYTPSYGQTQSVPAVTYQPSTMSSNAQAPAAAPDTDTANTAGVTAASNNSVSNPGAATVLAFIEQRLATDVNDGASQEELQSRIEAGFEGFMKGFTEAAEQLRDMGLYEGAVKAAVEGMFNQVVQGINDMAEQYGLASPATDVALFDETAEPLPAETAQSVTAGQINSIATAPQDFIKPFTEDMSANQDAQNFQTLIAPTQDFYTRIDKEESESNLYSFQLKTTDGDVVTIRSYADQGERFQSVSGPAGSDSQYDRDAMDNFQLTVEGDLDAGEMGAITDLLSQLNDVAESFFGGDIYQAYEKALEVGFDTDEIMQFSLNLSQTTYSRIESAYGGVANAGTEKIELQSEPQSFALPPVDNRVARMSEFIQQLEAVRERTSELGFDSTQLPALAEFTGRPKFGQHPHFPQYQPFMGQMFGALERHHTEG